MAMDFYTLITEFLDLNDQGRGLLDNYEYFRAGYELLCAACPYAAGYDETREIVSALLYAHDDWYDPLHKPFDI